MVDLDEPDDEEVKEQTAKQEPKKKKNIVKILLWVFIPLFVLSITIGATIYIVSALMPATPTAVTTNANDDVQEEDVIEEDEDIVDEVEGDGESREPLIYVDLDPPFVVNIMDNDRLRFLQIVVYVATRNEDSVELIAMHLPAIRNNLTQLFSVQIMADILSREGKQRLRAEALAEVQSILADATGDEIVEEIYFTSFVVQ